MERKVVLLVEDDGVVRDLIKEFLERDYKVLEASSYKEAIKYLEKHIDLALIDYSLPDKNGFEVLKTIREVKTELPSILITAYGTEDLAIRSLRAGATDYIKKPLSPSYLMRRVSEILKGKDGDGDAGDIETAGGFDKLSREEFIMDSIAAYIEERYMEEDLSRDKLARKACMNRYKFSRIFRRRFGQNFKSYLNNIRIKNAVTLLKNPDLSITEIAYSVGYRSIQHFERVFRKVYEVSPRKYRQA